MKSIVALLGLVPFIAGCITVQGSSSGEMQEAMLNSFLFKSADVFYPKGVPSDPGKLPELGVNEFTQIGDGLNSLIAVLNKMHSRTQGNLSTALERPVESELDIRLELVNTGNPVWRVTKRPPNHVVVHVDVKVAQAVFRTALLAGLRGRDSFGPRRAGRETAKQPADEAAAIASFLQLKKRVEDAPAGSIFGDLLGGVRGDFDNNRWFAMTDFLEISEEVQRHYFGPFFFMLAHEMGHAALGHFDRVPGQGVTREQRCDLLKGLELEADAYAVLLQTLDPLALPMQMVFQGPEVGFEGFFAYTYGFAGFTEDKCAYPDRAVRLERLRKLSRNSSADSFSRMWQSVWKQMEEEIAKSKRDASQ